MKRKIKRPNSHQGQRTQVKPPDASSSNYLHPAFCFKHLQPDYNLERCSSHEKAALSETLVHLSQISWSTIQSSGRHGLGHEKIASSALKTKIPNAVPEDRNFLSFRFCGKKPMIGYRVDKIFYVLWIDTKFSVYSH